MSPQAPSASPSLYHRPAAEIRAAVLAEKARRSGSRSFAAFVKQAWPLIEPATPLVWSWYLDAICLHLEAFARGQIRYLIINIPPRHLKTSLSSVLWPTWRWTTNPAWRLFCATYAKSLTLDAAQKMRQLVESEWYQEQHARPGGWRLADDKNQLAYFATTANGHRFSTSVEAGTTGYGGDDLLFDDLLNAQDAFSPAARLAAARWTDNTVGTRLNDPRSGGVVIIAQRLHEDDPIGHLLAKPDAPNWQILRLPTEYEADNPCITCRDDGTELWRDPRTEEGDLLCPERFGPEEVKKARAALGEEAHAAQHQQRPTPKGGNLFRIGDWRFWKPDGSAPDQRAARPKGCDEGPAKPRPARFDSVVISVDGTFKKTERGSFVAMHAWASAGARRLLLDREHDRMDYDTCERRLIGDRSLGRTHPIGGFYGRVQAAYPHASIIVIVEDKANGSMLVNRLTSVLDVPRVIGVSPGSDDKEKRASVYSLPYQRAGNAELPDGAPWVGEYIAEHGAFPLGKYNDDVDAQSQALQHLETPLTTAELLGRVKW